LTPEARAGLKEKYPVGDATINDIFDELKKPGRDPRETYPKPVMQKGVVTFEDLKEGMTVTGKIKNVVDFGAFVDLGIKETALVHISELSDSYVKDPMDLVKAGDLLEFRIIGLDAERRRISLSRKSSPRQGATGGPAPKQGGGQKPRVVAVRGAGASERRQGSQQQTATVKKRGFVAEDDGLMYNPFAEAFKQKSKV
jgi:uncharacterized protein